MTNLQTHLIDRLTLARFYRGIPGFQRLNHLTIALDMRDLAAGIKVHPVPGISLVPAGRMEAGHRTRFSVHNKNGVQA